MDVRKVMLWIATVLVAVGFLFNGASKLVIVDEWNQNFVDWGYPGWMHWVIGTVELVAGLLILWPRVAGYAGAVLVGTMLGAIVTHLANAEWLMWFPALVLGLLSAYVAYQRRPEWVDEKLVRA